MAEVRCFLALVIFMLGIAFKTILIELDVENSAYYQQGFAAGVGWCEAPKGDGDE